MNSQDTTVSDMLKQCVGYQRRVRGIAKSADGCPPAVHGGVGRLGLPTTEDVALAVDGPASVLLRQAFRACGMDEKLPFALGLDSKLVFARLIELWSPGACPQTWGLAEGAQCMGGGRELLRFLRRRPRSFVVKHAYGSGSEERFDQVEMFDPDGVFPLADPREETHLVQRRVSISSEFRVHSVGNKVVPGATDHRYSAKSDDGMFSVVEAFVDGVLKRMPPGLVSHLVLGWDVSVDGCGRTAIIEANLTGLHHRDRPGFQTSGFFSDPGTGPGVCAAVLSAMGAELGPTPPDFGLHLPGAADYLEFRDAVRRAALSRPRTR